jgi:glutaredoxin 3
MIDIPARPSNIVGLKADRTDDAMPQVEIYTRAFCGYCARALALLRDKGVDFEEYDITLGGPQRAEMLERAHGRATVPQIFIDGAHVGGCDDLMALEASGKLDAMLGG